MRNLGIVFIICVAYTGISQADIFKMNDNGSNGQFQRAVAEDSQGFYYRDHGDDDLTSYFKGPFDYGTDTLKRKVSRQVNLNASISRQIPKILSGVDIDSAMRQVSASPLMLWQYTSPAAADLFKHMHTMSQLKLNMFYDDVRGLEKNLEGDMDLLRDESELECVRDKLARNEFGRDIIDLMISCRDMGTSPGAVFSHLNYSAGGIKVYDRLFNRLHLRDHKADILEILPNWTINPDGYQLLGPEKRIGEVFADARARVMEEMGNALKTYQQNKTVGVNDLNNFSLPGVPFTEQSIRNLASLPEEQGLIMMSHLSTELAFAETVRRYDMAAEWLGRVLIHPMVEEAYKSLVRKGLDFIGQEKASLEVKHRQLRQYAAVMKSLLDASEAEWMDSVARTQQASQHKDNEETRLWIK